MPTDTSAGSPPEGEAAQPADDENLVFAAHDLGRDRPVPARRPDEDADFAEAPRPGETGASPPPAAIPTHTSTPARAGFVIRDMVDDAPRAPVDTLVVNDTPPALQAGAIVPKSAFRITSSPATPVAGGVESPLPWTVRGPAPQAAVSQGWTPRAGGRSERSAKDTLRRLREDAVHVSWRAAWIAVTSADQDLFKRRGR